MIFYIWLISALDSLILYFRQVYSRFSRYGVKHATPIPPVGTLWRIVSRQDHLGDDILRSYNQFPDERFVGKYEFLKPTLLIRDIELIKKIAVKEFQCFIDHRTVVTEEFDPLFALNLFCLKGQKWKDMRSTLSPAFTSSKMKMMVPFMVEVGNQMIHALKNQINASTSKYVDLDARDLTSRYANDVIASCAFGLKVDSHNDRENLFYKTGRIVSTFDFRQTLLIWMFGSFPNILTKLNLSLFPKSTIDFFKTIVNDTMKDRETRNIVRHDLIQLLMEAKKGKHSQEDNTTNDSSCGFATVEEFPMGENNMNRTWTDNELIAQAMVFFNAGFDTISSSAAFLLHELALHPDVQNRLYQEIMDLDQRTGGKIDYSSIQEMTYMDMVVSELLRFWPAASSLDRACMQDYNMGKPNAEATQDYIMRKGEALQIPLIAIHHDPKYFPNPSKFDPERFSEENKHNIQPFTYMPFGLGPRNCIGSRFALCEVKVMVYQLLRAVEVSPCERTQLKARVDPDSFIPRILGGHWMRFTPRK